LKEDDILFVHSFGKLFGLIDKCFSGGMWTNPIIIGPFYENCKQIADELEKLDTIAKVDSEEQITRKVKSNFDIPLQELKKYTSNKKAIAFVKK